MKRSSAVILFVAGSIFLASFVLHNSSSPQEKIKDYYARQYNTLVERLQALRTAVETDKNETDLHRLFLQSRLTYKPIEFLVEYYFELDVNKINGPPVDFIEEEDPAAFQEPQGFQVIEALLYPAYDLKNKSKLLEYIGKLLEITTGLRNNAALFNPDDYIPDAAMEELYRITALGITGFDSQLAHLSLAEADASLSGIEVMWKAFKDDAAQYRKTSVLLTGARKYLQKNGSFDAFDRMHFIKNFLNPLCTQLRTISKGFNNPARPALIAKTSHLFDASSVRSNIYLGDDTLTVHKIELGKQLFSEPLLSANGKRSCATCHQPVKAFTDGRTKALQLDEHITLPRNSPTLWNAALQRNLFSDSRQVSLDYLIMEVLSNEKEMNKGIDEAAHHLKAIPIYTNAFEIAYAADTLSVGRQAVNAIAMYLRTLISYNSRFDRFMRGDGGQLTAEEIRGFNVFSGKGRCATCHFMPFFNGSKPPTYFYQESEVIGVPATKDTIQPMLDADGGRFEVTKKEFHKHAFKTPTLRNIELTAPYMHNGVYNTLDEVLDFYNKGGGDGLGIGPANLTLLPGKLNLSKDEMNEVVAFLKALTDTTGIGYSAMPTAK